MTRLPAMSYRELTRRLRAAGFAFDRHAKGSHEIWMNFKTKRRATIPNHPGDIPRGTIMAILRGAGLTTRAFLDLE